MIILDLSFLFESLAHAINVFATAFTQIIANYGQYIAIPILIALIISNILLKKVIFLIKIL